jgi:hypothetical protein
VEDLPSTIASDVPNEEAAKWVAEIGKRAARWSLSEQQWWCWVE